MQRSMGFFYLIVSLLAIYFFLKIPLSGIGNLGNCCIFVTVFHRILDFKNGAGCLSGPLFLLNSLLIFIEMIVQDFSFGFPNQRGQFPF
jgi:hypothetical protein